MPTQIKKLYHNITDTQMLQHTQTILDQFNTDINTFQNFDATLNTTYKDQAQALINTAIAYPTNESILNQITELTNNVKTTWDACCSHFQQAKYFIEKAFPNNTARHNVFGYNDYYQMSRNQNNVQSFMQQFSDTAIKYQSQLITAGYTQTKINAILTLAQTFNTANRAQQSAIKNRLETTQTRTTTMNLVWSKIKTINQASKTIYRTNYAKLQQYLMPAPATNESPQNLSLTGTIINTTTNQPEPHVQVTLPTLNITTTTDLHGRYGFTAGTPPGNTTLIATKPGFAPHHSTVTLSADTLTTKNLQLTPHQNKKDG